MLILDSDDSEAQGRFSHSLPAQIHAVLRRPTDRGSRYQIVFGDPPGSERKDTTHYLYCCAHIKTAGAPNVTLVNTAAQSRGNGAANPANPNNSVTAG